MDKALCSILCDNSPWHHRTEWSPSMTFRHGGTGEMLVIGDIGTFILACEFEWRCMSPVKPVISVRQPMLNFSLWASPPELLGTLQLEITLKQALSATWQQKMPGAIYTNDRNFNELAWRTRLFTVDIERGRFAYSHVQVSKGEAYQLRLVFDVSPFPPAQAYKKTDHSYYVEWWKKELLKSMTLCSPAPDRKSLSRQVLALREKSIPHEQALDDKASNTSPQAEQQHTANANEKLCSILCGQDSWDASYDWTMGIMFRPVGTGDIYYSKNDGLFCVFSLSLTWQALPIPPNVQQAIKWTKKDHPHVLGGLQLQLTLNDQIPVPKHLTLEQVKRCCGYQQGLFDETAWQPRVFTVLLEEGSFNYEHVVDPRDPRNTRWKYRLRFSKSPYPPRVSFRSDERHKGGPLESDIADDCERTTLFRAEVLRGPEAQGRATNDTTSSWQVSDCIMSWKAVCAITARMQLT